MATYVDLTAESRQIANMKEWVLKQRTHGIGGQKSLYRIKGQQGSFNIDVPMGSEKVRLEWNIKNASDYSKNYIVFQGESNGILYEDDVLSIKMEYNGLSSPITFKSKSEFVIIEGDITVYVDYKLKTIDEIYIPDTIARTEQVEEIATEVGAIQTFLSTPISTPLTLMANWVVGTDGNVSCRKVGNFVEVAIRNVSYGVDSTENAAIICTLPTEFRPTTPQYYVCMCSGTVRAQIGISTNGAVRVSKIWNGSEQLNIKQMGSIYFSCLFLCV